MLNQLLTIDAMLLQIIDPSQLETILKIKDFGIGGVLILILYYFYTELNKAKESDKDRRKEIQELNNKTLAMQEGFTEKYQEMQIHTLSVIAEMKETLNAL